MLDMGLGKTLITLRTLCSQGERALVIAPLKPLYNTWPDEIVKWTPELSFTMLHDSTLSRTLEEDSDVYLINPEGMERLYYALEKYYKKYKKIPFTTLVLDEGSVWKSHSAKRFKILDSLLDMFPNYRYILSGTPAPHSLHDLWSQYYILDGGASLGKNISTFRERYFRVNPNCKHQWFLTVEESELYKKVEHLTYRLDARDHIEYCNSSYIKDEIELNKAHSDQYKQLQKDFYLSLDENASETEAFTTAQLQAQLRQFVQGALYTDHPVYEVIHTTKIERLKTILARGDNVLCAIQFRFELDMLKKAFPDAPSIVGGVNSDTANRLMRKWNTGEIPLLIVHPQAVAHGVNIQFGGHVVVWLGLTWNLEHYLQLNGRLVRPGQEHDVEVIHIIAKGTIDEAVYKSLQNKEKVQDSFLQHMREVTG